MAGAGKGTRMASSRRPNRAEVLKALRAVADAERGVGMRAYLKSAMPCLGVRVPEARRIAKALFSTPPFESRAELEALVRGLWSAAEFREERFVALNVLRQRAHREWLTAAAAPLLEELIRSGAWWDLVDELSMHPVADALEHDPVKMTKVLRRWAASDELWLKRAALVCQVLRGDETDDELLAYAIEHAVDGKDFFLRKGIGWALRSRARSNPALVRQWLSRWQGRLSPLSVREAKKAL